MVRFRAGAHCRGIGIFQSTTSMEGEASHKAHRHAKAGRKAEKKKAAKNNNTGPSRKDKTQNPKVHEMKAMIGHSLHL